MSRIVFFGNEQLAQGLERPATPIFDALITGGYEIAAVVLPRDPSSKSRPDSKPAIITAAEENHVPIIFADQLADLDETLREIDAEIGILASYGQMVPQSTIEVFPHGIVNIHPSLLPKYRGSTPIETAISSGDQETGVSLMNLVKEMDAGGIFAQEKLQLNGSESKQALYEKLASLGAKLLIETLPAILSGDSSATPQNDNEATYTEKLTKDSGFLDPTIMTAGECERKIRAYFGFPRTRMGFLGQETIITAARVLENYAGDDWPDVVKCSGNTFLQIQKLISPKSGKEMTMGEYLRGLK